MTAPVSDCTSNCSICSNKKLNNDPTAHCYMFKEPPVGVCYQHDEYREARSINNVLIHAISNLTTIVGKI